jgi:hypothetical protein
VIAAALALLAAPQALPAARPCGASEIAALLADAAEPYRLTCRARLTPGAAVRRPLLIEGAEASGAALDCAGGAVGRPGVRTTTAAATIAISSRQDDAGWSRPTDIAIRNCTVHGAVRIQGMGAGGGYEALRASSRTAGHTAATQAAAPTRVTLADLTFEATGSIPLYIGSGVTGVEVSRARFRGRSDAVAAYLDAESARNVITDSDFDIRTGREQVAVDGSADNRVTGNRFALRWRGGVFLYRNCGERGVVRHQAPSGNLIADNLFAGARWFWPRTVVLGARGGRQSYCGEDAGGPFGSSADDGDRATGNTVSGNRTRFF